MTCIFTLLLDERRGRQPSSSSDDDSDSDDEESILRKLLFSSGKLETMREHLLPFMEMMVDGKEGGKSK